jgi:hypothetical protein
VAVALLLVCGEGDGKKLANLWQRRNLTYLAAVVAVLLGAWFYSHTTSPQSGSVWSVLISDRLTLSAIRVGIVFAAAYVVYSVTVQIRRGHPLTRMASAQVEDSVEQAQQNVEDLRPTVAGILRERDDLLTQLTTVTETLGKASAEIARLEGDIERLKLDLDPTLAFGADSLAADSPWGTATIRGEARGTDDGSGSTVS